MAVNVKGGALEFDALINDSQFGAVIRKMEMQLQGLTRTAEKEAKSIDNLMQKTATAIGAYASFASARELIRSIIQVRGEFQQLEVSFNTMLGSKEKADKLLAEAVELAAKTPFTLRDVGSGAKQLLAYGFGAGEVTETLRRLGDVASGVSAPLNDIVYLYGTTRTQGRLYAQDLMQFTSRGIPIIAELAKQFSVTEGEVKKLVEEGKVGFPEVQKVIMSLTSQGGLFFNLMEKQSKTLTGQISNLQDAWDRMLNEIGKENEGFLSSAISSAITLVENYETVLDILKVLAITYGTYRAALVATVVIENIHQKMLIQQAVAGTALTTVQKLQAVATISLQRAWKALNATMLANPGALAITVLAGLIASCMALVRATTQVKSSTELMNDAMEDGNKQFAESVGEVKKYTATLKNQNIAESVRLDAYNKLKDIAPDIIKQLSFQEAKTADLTDATNTYIASLQQKIRLEALQSSYAKALQQQEEARQAQLKASAAVPATRPTDNGPQGITGTNNAAVYFDTMKKAADAAAKAYENASAVTKEIEDQISVSTGQGTKEAIEARITAIETEMKYLDESSLLYKEREDLLISLQKARDKLNKTPENKAPSRTVEMIEAEIKREKQLRDEQSATSKEYLRRTAIIQKLEKELERITGKQGEKLGSKRESALKKLLEDITDAERAALRSGLAKEESEIDRINARYDELKQKAEKLKADPLLFRRIENARATEVGNERMKNEAAAYEKSLEDQKDIFGQYEEAKKELGIQLANQMFSEQTKGFDSFISYLEAEAKKFQSIAWTSRGQSFLNPLASQLSDAQKDKNSRGAKEETDRLADLIKSTQSFNIQRKKIEEQYQKDVALLRKRFTGLELTEREAQLTESRDQDIADLESQQARSSAIFKLMNQDLINFSRTELKRLVAQIDKMLKDATDLPPELEARIRSFTDGIKDLLKETGKDAKTAEGLGQAASYAGELASNLQNVADSVRETNAELADTLGNLSEILSIAESGLSAAASALSGDIGGAVSSVFSYYTKVFDFIFAAPKRTAAQTKAIIDQFQANVLAGEQELNALYRERALQQSRINKLKLEGIQAERKELEKQQKAVQEQFAATLAELQKQVAVVGKTGEKYGGVLGIGRKTRAKDITESLAGRSYDDLEKLFMKGQLEGKALELFNLLQKLKQEGADIDAMLLQNAQDLKEMLTGTTSDSITDSILEGFKNGKRGARDFADDFEAMMKDALFQSLKFQALEGPLKEFYEQFAANADSDGMLTEEEIRILRERFNSIINDAGKKFEDLQALTNLGLTGSATGSGNNLAGAIRGITADQADLLAGQFGGLRITALDQLRVGTQQLDAIQAIQNHTSNLPMMYRILQRLEQDGIKVK